MTPLILKFYNDVARIVGREFPDRLLCGYVYAQYLYPPTAGIPPMEPNVCLVVAASIDYGYPVVPAGGAAGTRGAAEAVGSGGAHDGVLRFAVAARANLCPRRHRHRRAFSVSSFSNAASSGMKGVYVYGVRRLGLRRSHELCRGQARLEPAGRPVCAGCRVLSSVYGRRLSPAT